MTMLLTFRLVFPVHVTQATNQAACQVNAFMPLQITNEIMIRGTWLPDPFIARILLAFEPDYFCSFLRTRETISTILPTASRVPTLAKMASVTKLCEYCSLIDLSYLRNPTAAEIDSLNAGERPTEDRFPLKFGQPIDGDPSWTLGRANQICASADTCVFCKAVKEVLVEYEDELTKLEAVGLKDPLCYATCDIAGALQPPKGTAWEEAQPGEANPEFVMRRLAIYFIPFDENSTNGLNPGRVGFKEASWKRIFHCFQTYDAARSQDSFNVETFFGGPHNSGEILFAGRKRPSKVDMRLPIQWVKHCKENHTSSCGSAQVKDRDEDQDEDVGSRSVCYINAQVFIKD